MIQNQKKLVGVITGLLLVGRELSAANPTLYWGPNATAVPMSTTSMAIMAALFMIGGLWVLSKTQKKAQSFLVMAVLMTGAYNFATVVQANVSPKPITITDDNAEGGSESIGLAFGSDVVNESSDAVTLTVDRDGCVPYQSSLKSPTFSKSVAPVPFCVTGMSLNAGNGRCFIRLTCP